MRDSEREKLLRFFDETDDGGMSNREKALSRAKVIRRVAATDKSRSFEEAESNALDSALPGVVVRDGKVIGMGIHIYNEDVYPLQSFEIYLRGCGLSGRLDLSECRDLIFLDIYNNSIETVTLGDLPALRILGVQNNRISALDPSGLSACQGIDAGKNLLTSIDVTQNAELVELYVNDNALSEINLHGNPKLKYFYCHNNKISKLDATANPLLRHLDATGNPLREIRCYAPQRETLLPLNLTASEGGFVGLRFKPIYNAQWKETGEWEQSYFAYPEEAFRFAGWYAEDGECVSKEEAWTDTYGTSRSLTAEFEKK